MSIRRGTPGDLVFVATQEEFNRDITNNPWDLAFYGSYGAKLNPTNLNNASIKWNIDEGTLVIAQHFSNASSQLTLEKSRGTSAVPRAVLDGDTLSSIHMSGYDGGQYVLGAFISAVVDGVVDGDSMPTKLVFGTNPNQFAEPQAELLGDGTLKVKRITGFDDNGLEIIFKDGTVTSSIGGGGSSIANTDELEEGLQNLYFTQARARSAISTQALTGVFYNPTTGAINLASIPNSSLANKTITINGTSIELGGSGTLSLSTTGITEGTNLYYSNSRARSALSAGLGISYDTSTGVITNTITQYTDALARNAVSAGGDITYNSEIGEFYYVTPNIIQSLDNHTTTSLREGTNLYFTQTRARSSFTAGYGILIQGGVIGADSNILAPVTYVDDQIVETKNYIDDLISNIDIGPKILNDLDDVALAQVAHGQYLTYNTNVGKWVNGNLPANQVFNNITATNITATDTYTDILNVKDINFIGLGPVTINSNNDLLFTAVGDIKFNGKTLKPVAFSGSYTDLINKPTLLQGPQGPQGSQGPAGPQGPAGTTDYNNLINKPTIPTDINQLNDTSGILLNNYQLPTATTTVLGGVKIGSGLSIDGSGVVSVTGGGSVASVNGQTGVVTLTSSNIAEGTNQYFTTARARSSVSAGTGLGYNSITGVISANAIPNASLANSSITIGTTAISLGSSATTVAGLANVVTKKSSYADSSNVSKVYTYYNEETQSLDTVFE